MSFSVAGTHTCLQLGLRGIREIQEISTGRRTPKRGKYCVGQETKLPSTRRIPPRYGSVNTRKKYTRHDAKIYLSFVLVSTRFL